MSFDIHVTGHVADVVRDAVPALAQSLVASGITAGDTDLWGPDAEAEAAQRLGWVQAVTVSRPLVAEIEALRASFLSAGLTRFVLAAWAAPRSRPRSSRARRVCPS